MPKKRILIVDDEKGFTDLVKATLEETDEYEVKTENSGRKGLLSVRTFLPDLILLDLMMPDLDGTWVADQIKNDPNTGDIPIIFLTAAVTAEETREKEGFIGGRFFIAKPVVLKDLIDRVGKMIRDRGL